MAQLFVESFTSRRYGEDYWMLEMDLDCTRTENSWFEVKGWLEFAGAYTGWELDVAQQRECSGDVGGQPPFPSIDHVARCGYINVFTWNEGGCIISSFPSFTTATSEATTVTTPNMTHSPGSTDATETTAESSTMTSEPSTTTTELLTTTTESPVKRTVIFIEQHTTDGQNVFLRGGLGEPLIPSLSKY